MAVQTVTLSGDALDGVGPRAFTELVALPQTVHLGRIRPPIPQSTAPQLKTYMSIKRMTTPPPVSINRRDKAADALTRMYLNDTYGDCVIAGKAHALAVWSANDKDSLGIVTASDQEIYQQYQSICGPGDNGCNIASVLEVMRDKGFLANGKLYKIDGYVQVDWTNKIEVQVAQYLFGATTIGINLPQDWTEKAVWDVTSSQIVGGHDVTPIDYDEKGVYVSSWGRIYLITWNAFLSKNWLEEFYAILAPLWYGNDQLAPCGIDATTLRVDLTKLGSGIIPSIDPTPTPTPTPPIPPTPVPVPPPIPHGPTMQQAVDAAMSAIEAYARQHPMTASWIRGCKAPVSVALRNLWK